MTVTITQDLSRAIGAISGFITITQDLSRPLGTDTLQRVLVNAPTGLVGILQVSVTDTAGSTLVYAPTVDGIMETPAGSGRYVATLPMPAIGEYFAVWQAGSQVRFEQFEIFDEPAPAVVHTMNGQQWPDGTTVSVYPAAAWPEPDSSPSGSPVTTGLVDSGSVTFLDLQVKVRYVAYALAHGVRFSVQPTISDDISGTTPGRERDEAVQAKLTSLAQTVGAADFITDPVTEEAQTRAGADAALSARLDQLEAVDTGTLGNRVNDLEEAVAVLQAAVASIEGGEVFANLGASWSS